VYKWLFYTFGERMNPAVPAFSEDINRMRQSPQARRARYTIKVTALVFVLVALIMLVVDVLLSQRDQMVLRYNRLSDVAGQQVLLTQIIAYHAEMLISTTSSTVRFQASTELYRASVNLRGSRLGVQIYSQADFPEEIAFLYEKPPANLNQRIDEFVDAAASLARAPLERLERTNEDYVLVSSGASRLANDLAYVQDIYIRMVGEAVQQTAEMNRGRTVLVLLVLTLLVLVILMPGQRAINRYAFRLYERLMSYENRVKMQDERYQFIEVLLDALPNGLALFDGDTGQILYTNQRLRKTLGYDDPGASELFSMTTFVHPEDIGRALACSKKTIQSGLPALGTYRVRLPDGGYSVVESRATATANGHLITLLRPLNEAVETPLESRDTLPIDLLDSVSLVTRNIVFVYDLEPLKLRYISPAVTDLLGYSLSEMLTTDWHTSIRDVIHPDDRVRRDVLRSELAMLADGEAHELVLRVRHKDGQWRSVYMRMLIYDRDDAGKPVTVVGICSDLRVKSLSK
jgi:PAS domain-containing protein